MMPGPLLAIPPTVVALSDYEPLALERLTPPAQAYLNGGAAGEVTLRRNRAAFDELALRGRVLADLRGGHTRLELFGQRLEHPILLAPVAYLKLAHPAGELEAWAGARAVGAPFVVSTHASTTLEAIADDGAHERLWFQLYPQPDRALTRQLVQRAEAAGYRAIVVTLDAPVNGIRNREQRAAFSLPLGVEAANTCHHPAPPAYRAGPGTPLCGGILEHAPTWEDLPWLRSLTALPLLLKGIMDPADALRAVDLGVDGLVVSNHGGRTLDTLPATIEVLPAIADAVNGRVPLLFDGGIRRGTDILKALALGARAVLVGRPYVHALAAAGAPGVAHVVNILRAELEVAMALSGCRDLGAAGRHLLWTRPR